jgi:hypothetical protein
MSGGLFYFGNSLLNAHGRFLELVLKYTSIPITGYKPVEVFPYLETASAPEVPFPSNRANPVRTGFLFVASIAGLILIHRSIPLGRNFVVFLATLICAAAGVILFGSFNFDSAMYTRIWLRGEILVWILLPWISSLMFILILPSVVKGIVCALMLQLYVVVWSAIRLAFCLGTMHYTGILFLPLLWFCLGVLFDFVCLVFFYSFALDQSVRQVMGERKL